MVPDSLDSQYEVIIIGAGIGGLTCGALLAQAGKKVLIVEQQQVPGGAARDYKYGSYTINPSLHAIMGCNPDGPFGQGIVDAVLTQLGVQDECEFTPMDSFYRAQLPDFVMDIPTGRQAYLDEIYQYFPENLESMRKLVDLCAGIYREFMDMPSMMRWSDWLGLPFRSPKLFRHANATLGSVVEKYISDPRLRSVYSIVYPYLALPPSQLSFLLWAVMMADYIEGGTYYCMGGFQPFVNALVKGFTKNGGEMLLGSRVDKIIVSENRVQGIELQNHHRLLSTQVISNIDPRIVFQELISSRDVNEKYRQKLSRSRPSLAVFRLNLATDINVQQMDIAKVTIVSDWDLEAVFMGSQRGEIRGAAVHVPSVVDPGLAPPGENVVIIQGFAPLEAAALTSGTKDKITNQLLDIGEKVIPNLRNHISFAAGRSTDNNQELPLQRINAIYGWENSISQSGNRRLSPITPINELFLTGHWTQPGSGILTVVLSGILTSRIALKKNLSAPIQSLS